MTAGSVRAAKQLSFHKRAWRACKGILPRLRWIVPRLRLIVTITRHNQIVSNQLVSIINLLSRLLRRPHRANPLRWILRWGRRIKLGGINKIRAEAPLAFLGNLHAGHVVCQQARTWARTGQLSTLTSNAYNMHKATMSMAAFYGNKRLNCSTL